MARIVLDTDVVSLYRAGRLPASFERQVVTNDISIAFATAGELWKGALAKRWGPARRGGLDLWLNQTGVLPAGLAVAQIWGALMAAAQRRGRPRPLQDTWIAACCIEGGLPRLTMNRRDFADFAGHDALVLVNA
jgi:predicted nucleic acid-binding protein